MRHIETKNYKRISKNQARKIYNSNGELYMIPCNIHPENAWGMLLGPVNTFEPFEKMIQWATWYNCDAERGRYLAFYVKKGGE